MPEIDELLDQVAACLERVEAGLTVIADEVAGMYADTGVRDIEKYLGEQGDARGRWDG